MHIPDLNWLLCNAFQVADVCPTREPYGTCSGLGLAIPCHTMSLQHSSSVQLGSRMRLTTTTSPVLSSLVFLPLPHPSSFDSLFFFVFLRIERSFLEICMAHLEIYRALFGSAHRAFATGEAE